MPYKNLKKKKKWELANKKKRRAQYREWYELNKGHRNSIAREKTEKRSLRKLRNRVKGFNIKDITDDWEERIMLRYVLWGTDLKTVSNEEILRFLNEYRAILQHRKNYRAKQRRKHPGLYLENISGAYRTLYDCNLKPFIIPPQRQKRIKPEILTSILKLVLQLDKIDADRDKTTSAKKKAELTNRIDKAIQAAVHLGNKRVAGHGVIPHFDAADKFEKRKPQKLYSEFLKSNMFYDSWHPKETRKHYLGSKYTSATRTKKSSATFKGGKIICADNVKTMRKMRPRSVNLIWTSPPYGFDMDYDSSWDSYDGEWKPYYDYLAKLWKQCWWVLKPGGYLVVNIAPKVSESQPTHHKITNQLLNAGFRWREEIIWEKEVTQQMSRRLYATHEYVLAYQKPSRNGLDIKTRLKKRDLSEKELKDWADPGRTRWNITPVRGKATFDHPCPFPLELCNRVIKLFSRKGDLVLDPFSGIGQTALSALGLRRRFIGIDLSKKYCQTAIQRLKTAYNGANGQKGHQNGK